MNKTVGILGSGVVGQTLAKGIRDIGFEVTIASRDGHAVDDWSGSVGSFKGVAVSSDLLVLAVKGNAAEELIGLLKGDLSGKTVIDATNPIGDKPPEDGVLSFFTSLDDSLMERLQVIAPEAKFVKAFNSVGSAQMVNPKYEAGKPSMFICGNSVEAKAEVSEIIEQFGWEVEDMGGVKSARAIEPLCMLWCIPGMLSNQWSHAFKLLKS